MLDALKTYLRYTSWPIISAMVTLMTIGVLAIRASEGADATIRGYADQQVVYAAVGLCAFVAVTVVPYARFGRLAYPLFAVTLAMLVAVLFQPAVRGAHRWVDVRLFKVQPSEIAKFTFIVMLAWYLRYGDHYRRLRGLAVPFVLTFVPMAMILVEPDLGTSLLFLPTLYFMLLMAGAKLRHLLVIVALGTLAVLCPVPCPVDGSAFAADAGKFKATRIGPLTFYRVDESLDWRRRPETPVAYCRYRFGGGKVYDLQPLCLRMMKGHQSERVEGWLRQGDPRITMDKGYQGHQSMVLLGSGRWLGQDAEIAGQAPFSALPDDHTDFIFSVVGGKRGFVGCLTVLFLYGVVFLYGVEIAAITYDPFGRLLAVGVVALLFSQLVINAGMTMGLMPITGMTLPLVSYGGSSLVVNCAALGLLVNVGQRRPILLSAPAFEYGPKKERPPAPYGPVSGGAELPPIRK